MISGYVRSVKSVRLSNAEAHAQNSKVKAEAEVEVEIRNGHKRKNLDSLCRKLLHSSTPPLLH